MIHDNFVLSFNGKNLLKNDKEMNWERNIYQVTTSTDGHGSITASPMSGYQGTTVSLSNTPNMDYRFTGYSVTGATLTGNQFTLNNDVTVHAGFTFSLHSNTVRVRTYDGNPPIKNSAATFETATLVPGTTDVYDVYKSGTDFTNLLRRSTNIIEVIAANTTGITSMNYMFYYCTQLEAVPLFDTSSVTSMAMMFYNCQSLTSVPLFDTSKVTNMSYMFYFCTQLEAVPLFDTSKVMYLSYMFAYCYSLTAIPLFDTSSIVEIGRMFYDCTNVQSGALALYQQASTQATPPTNHSRTFYNCGSYTTQGAAELAQIPDDWK